MAYGVSPRAFGSLPLDAFLSIQLTRSKIALGQALVSGRGGGKGVEGRGGGEKQVGRSPLNSER
jgi:hypothetical protein